METIEAEIGDITHKIYVHKKYIRLLVSDVYCKKKYGGVFNLDYPSINDTDDIKFEQPRPYFTDW